ncbi:unnamed protein product [Acanthoscelides obtectus]|uniref:DDE Tnp4 domain-containing protein n=1 Tax=Acanthoscelides obtectus TaxID=200917 RepID=A0A9P0JMX2_ACAOB|nr:unnamed protein product [Acanthoscelides obtectus]CAK1661115.1 Protein ALP1-like [Acanthoscelides obtectus]
MFRVRKRILNPSHVQSTSTMAANICQLLDLESESEDEERSILMYLFNRRRIKSEKNAYLRKRQSHGEFNLSREVPDSIFKETFRVNRTQFNEVDELIKNDITGKECNAQKPIGSEEKVAVCLRYLATGDMYKTIGLSYRMGQRTVSNIVCQVCEAIWRRLQPIYMPEPTVEIWKNIALEYERKWQFYNCLGAVDGKHVAIRKPLLSGSSFFNYKQYFSVVLMATVDANYRFTSVNVGSMGRFSDGNIFANSPLGKMLYNGSLDLPEPKPLPGQNTPTPYVFVGDEAFPLMRNLMRPYPKARVAGSYQNKVFNYRLSRARQTVESAFGILAARFRVYKRPFECKLDTIDKIVLATIVLHNYLRTKILSIATGQEENDEVLTNSHENHFIPLALNRTRNSTEAFNIRQKFTECFNSADGSVEWQRRAIERGQF